MKVAALLILLSSVPVFSQSGDLTIIREAKTVQVSEGDGANVNEVSGSLTIIINCNAVCNFDGRYARGGRYTFAAFPEADRPSYVPGNAGGGLGLGLANLETINSIIGEHNSVTVPKGIFFSGDNDLPVGFALPSVGLNSSSSNNASGTWGAVLHLANDPRMPAGFGSELTVGSSGIPDASMLGLIAPSLTKYPGLVVGATPGSFIGLGSDLSHIGGAAPNEIIRSHLGLGDVFASTSIKSIYEYSSTEYVLHPPTDKVVFTAIPDSITGMLKTGSTNIWAGPQTISLANVDTLNGAGIPVGAGSGAWYLGSQFTNSYAGLDQTSLSQTIQDLSNHGKLVVGWTLTVADPGN